MRNNKSIKFNYSKKTPLEINELTNPLKTLVVAKLQEIMDYQKNYETLSEDIRKPFINAFNKPFIKFRKNK